MDVGVVYITVGINFKWIWWARPKIPETKCRECGCKSVAGAEKLTMPREKMISISVLAYPRFR